VHDNKTKKSWVALTSPHKNRIYFIQYNFDDGRRCFYYLQVFFEKEKEFLKTMEYSDTINLEYYGIIIADGWGKPNEKLRNKLKSKYGEIH